MSALPKRCSRRQHANCPYRRETEPRSGAGPRAQTTEGQLS
jgi:hypothetical protein